MADEVNVAKIWRYLERALGRTLVYCFHYCLVSLRRHTHNIGVTGAFFSSWEIFKIWNVLIFHAEKNPLPYTPGPQEAGMLAWWWYFAVCAICYILKFSANVTTATSALLSLVVTRLSSHALYEASIVIKYHLETRHWEHWLKEEFIHLFSPISSYKMKITLHTLLCS